MKKFLLVIFSLAVAGGCFWLSMYLTAEDDAQDAMSGATERVAPAVEVATVERRPITKIVEYPGTVQAFESVSLIPRVTGIVKTINVNLGDRVEAGELVVTIDDGEFVQRLIQAKANLQLAQAQLERSKVSLNLAEREFQRIQTGSTQGVLTSQEMDGARAARDSALADIDLADAELERMRAAVDEAQLNLDNTRIMAPMSGVVEMRNVDPGAMASPTTPLLTIVNTDPAIVVVHVPESDITLAERGRQATVAVANGTKEFDGEVRRVSPTLSTTTRTTKVEIHVDNDDRQLRPGMSADVRVVAKHVDDALVVPESALVVTEDRLEAYIVLDYRARAVPITIGIHQDGFVQIENGLEEGDLVITKGQFLVKNGDQVQYGETVGRRVGS